jgi:hypothetical protein
MNKKLFDYMIETINQESDFLKDYNFNLIYSTFGNVSLAGSPAYQFVYVNTAPWDTSKVDKALVIGTIVGNTGYRISYAADLSSYSTYLETAKRMIESLQIDLTQ